MTVDELKPCPFCGNKAVASNELSREMFAYCDNLDCLTYGWGMPVDTWNTRPIEDGLRAEVDQLKSQGREKSLVILELEEKLRNARATIEMWQREVSGRDAEIDHLRAVIAKAEVKE